jgi:hypothetical protein
LVGEHTIDFIVNEPITIDGTYFYFCYLLLLLLLLLLLFY